MIIQNQCLSMGAPRKGGPVQDSGMGGIGSSGGKQILVGLLCPINSIQIPRNQPCMQGTTVCPFNSGRFLTARELAKQSAPNSLANALVRARAGNASKEG